MGHIRKRAILVLATLAVSLAVANAAVFVYYPAGVTAVPQAPDVVFAPGSNAGSPDLGGNTITVAIGANGTNASIIVHPTLEYNYYYNILNVTNNGGQAYYVNFYVKSTNHTAAGFAEAYLVVNGNKYQLISGSLLMPSNLLLNPGETITIGLLFYAPDDTNFAGNAVIDLYLVYSASNETVPSLP